MSEGTLQSGQSSGHETPARRVPAAERLLLGLLKRAFARADRGRLVMIVPEGRQYTFGGTAATGCDAVIHLHRLRALARLFMGGHLGFCEAYMDGDWDSPDLNAVFAFVLQNDGKLGGTATGTAIFQAMNRLYHRLKPNTRRGARRNIAAHYDLGNEFYRQWLDPSMTYSSALFTGEDQSLFDAQQEKYRQICISIGLRPGQRVLEIGCGWGGFAEFAAREYGAHVTGITISKAQHDYARNRLTAAGLAGRTEIRLVDYRDVDGVYDHVVSIEMFEAIGEKNWPAYFSVVRNRLKPGGKAALQIICAEESRFARYRGNVDFIQRYIFPGGMLGCAPLIREKAGRARLAPLGIHFFGPSYARTLALWAHSFAGAWPSIRRMGFDERFRRMWTLYLESCESWFAHGAIDVGLFTLERPS